MESSIPASNPDTTAGSSDRKWRPLSAIERRVLGVLIEKAKTTPDQYPLTLNSLRSGCNQKSNRAPVMELESEPIEAALQRLREAGCVTEVHDSGRVPKYRHHGYEWLGVDKVELAVMAELLLRGAQTVGELRGRAARMEPIPDLQALWPLLHALKAKGLVVFLTPEGRGCVVTHNLYPPDELLRLRSQFASDTAGAAHAAADSSQPQTQPRPALTAPAALPGESSELAALRSEVQTLRNELRALRQEFDELQEGLSAVNQWMQRVQEELGVQ